MANEKKIKVNKINCVGTSVTEKSGDMFIEVNGIRISTDNIVEITYRD